MHEGEAGIDVLARPLQAKIHGAAGEAPQRAARDGVAAALVAQRVAGPFELRAQPVHLTPGGLETRQAVLRAAEGGHALAAEEVQPERAAAADVARAGAEGFGELCQRVGEVAPRAQPPEAKAEREVERAPAAGGHHVLAAIDAGADDVLQPDREGGVPGPLLQQAQLHVEGAVGGVAAAGGGVQAVGEAEGRLQEGQGLEVEEDEAPLVAVGDAALEGAVLAEAGVAHLDQARAAEAAAGRRHFLGPSRQGCQGEQQDGEKRQEGEPGGARHGLRNGSRFRDPLAMARGRRQAATAG